MTWQADKLLRPLAVEEDAMQTAAIEGETLNRAGVHSSVARRRL